jgi:tetratricopeptide (TPR) repeat protein
VALAQEFKILASLRHPNIISVLDYGFSQAHQPYFTMELLEDADDLLTAGIEYPVPHKMQLVIQVLQALSYLHRRGIIHRDLKPGNVMVADQHVKVLDFGLAMAAEHLRSKEVDETTVGTIVYMAPELVRGHSASPASDLYAVGLMMYQLLTGKHPFLRPTIQEMVVDILNRDPDMSEIEAISPSQTRLPTQPDLPEDSTPTDFTDVEPVSLAVILARLLAKDPQTRYQNARDVMVDICAATGIPLPVETLAIRESYLQAAQFVGRENEYATLSMALEKAQAGTGSAWLIGGESGVGKSRLTDEIRTQALVDGMLVLRGQGVTEGGAPFLIWRDILRYLLLQTSVSELEASVLKLLVADIERLLGRPVADPPELDSQAAQSRVLMVIEALFRRQKRPMLIILEDLQWITETMHVLKRLSQVAGDLPMMILGNFRDDERPDLPKDLPDMQYIRLERLDPYAIEALSVAMLGEEVGHRQELVELLERETEGNVFFIVEVVRALAEEAGKLDDIGIMTLPSKIFAHGIQTVMTRRLNRVPESHHPLLKVAAVAGRQLDLKLLRGFLQAQKHLKYSLERWLTDCESAAVLEVQEDTWRFAHDKLREALLENLSGEERQSLHRQVATLLEALYPHDATKYSVLAHHWHEVGDHSKEQHYASLAGHQALSAGAYGEAIKFLGRAVYLAETEQNLVEIPGELQYMLGEAYYGSGDMVNAFTQLNNALRLFGLPSPKSKGRFVLGFLSQAMRQYWHRLTMERFNRWQHPTADSKRLKMAALACERLEEIHYFRVEKIPTIYYVMKGLNLAERAGVDSGGEIARFYTSMCAAFGLVAKHGIAQAYAKRADALAEPLYRRGEDPQTVSWWAQLRGLYEAGRANWSEGDRLLSIGTQVSRAAGDMRRYKESGSVLGYVWYYQGQYRRQETDMLVDMFNTIVDDQQNDSHIWAVVHIARAENYLRQGRLLEALDDLKASTDTLDEKYHRTETIRAYGVKAQAQRRLGDWEAACATARYGLKLCLETAPTSFFTLEAYSGTLETFLWHWEHFQTADYKADAQAALKLMKKFGSIFMNGSACAPLYEGWFQWLNGQPDKAHQLSQTAIETARKVGTPFMEAYAHYNLGRWAKLGDPQRLHHLQDALQLFEEIGAIHEVNEVRQLLESS